MPTVPRASRQNTLQPIRGGRLTAAPTALSEGAGLAEARAERFQQVGQLGQAAARTGIDLYAQMVADEARKAEETYSLKVKNRLSAFQSREVHDPTSGALTVTGENALIVREGVRQKWDALAGELGKEAVGDRQKLILNRIVSQEWESLDLTLQRHASQEYAGYREGEFKARLVNGVQDTMRQALDPKLVAQGIQNLVADIARVGPTIGLSPAEVEAQGRKVTSDIHIGVVRNLLAAKRSGEALRRLDAVADQIDPAALDDLRRATAQIADDVAGEQAAGDIWATLGPKSDSAPIELDVLEDEARKRFGDDVGGLNAALSAIRTRKQAADAGRQARENRRSEVVWGAVLRGQSYADVSQLAEFVESPDIQLKVRDYIQRQREHQENLANARENRLSAAAARQERTRTRNGWSAYWRLSDPAVLAQIDRGAILSELDNLGPEHVERLLNDKTRLEVSDDREQARQSRVRAATIEASLFKDVAFTAGLSYAHLTTARQTEDQRATMGRLHAATLDAISREQGAAGDTLPYERKREVMERVVAQTVMVDRAFSYDRPQIAAVVSPDDIPNAYVPMAEVPKVNATEAVNYLRSIGWSGSDAQIQQRAGRRIERAYAAKLLGLGAAEERSRLEGR